jgi:outer membrane biosynthesis protein TonB
MTPRAIVLVFMLLSGFLGLEARAITTPIQKPQSEKELEGTVEVSFRIDMAGKVEILSINASSPQLADYVIKKLNKIKLEKGDPQIGQVIKYRFVFKKQA